LKYKTLIILCLIFLVCTCIDPYTPKLKGYDSILVVEGLVTDENLSYSVKISKTIQDQNVIPEPVSDATVFITDDNKNKAALMYHGNGVYKSDSLVFRGAAGRMYTLHVITGEGAEYESEQCIMKCVPDIDSVYFKKDQELFNNGTESQDGIRIYLNSKTEPNRFLRWAVVETWKFSVPDPKMYDYLGSGRVVPVHDIKKYCWKTKVSDQVIISSGLSANASTLQKQPIFFIAPAKSDRLMLGYSILVKQYSISERENEFWNNLKKVNEGGGDIFASQPFSVSSNIHNINSPKERVLGFFQVSAVKQKRIFIQFSEYVKLNLPFYHNDKCVRVEKAPSEFGSELGPKVTFDELYEMFCIKSDFYFIEPVYNSTTNVLEKLAFARPECANCELTGTMTKPEFWVDSY
jgi:hypothetical protein